MKTLLHICCAPCANQPIEVLRTDKIEVTGFWYNPNIHPFTEYRARRNCLREYAEAISLPLLERDDYGLRPFVREVAADIAGRCVKCYEMRLFETARQASEGGFDSFTSSLFISPYQNHAGIIAAAEAAAAKYGVEMRNVLTGFKFIGEKIKEKHKDEFEDGKVFFMLILSFSLRSRLRLFISTWSAILSASALFSMK